MTERAYMEVVVRQCREFAQQYPDKGNSILFTGGTGVGKTFLTNCIAKELIDRCISVIYLSSNELFEIFPNTNSDGTARRMWRRATATFWTVTCSSSMTWERS